MARRAGRLLAVPDPPAVDVDAVDAVCAVDDDVTGVDDVCAVDAVRAVDDVCGVEDVAAAGAVSAQATWAQRFPTFEISSPGLIGAEQTPQVVGYLAVSGTRSAYGWPTTDSARLRRRASLLVIHK
jgi:hypothetical protein